MGANAPILYQTGRLEELKDYLLGDLEGTYEIMKKVLDNTIIL